GAGRGAGYLRPRGVSTPPRPETAALTFSVRLATLTPQAIQKQGDRPILKEVGGMRVHRMVLATAALATTLAPAPAQAQNAGLSGLLLRFFAGADPVILVTTTHPAHFGAQPGAQGIMTAINRSIASQIATFPLGSSSGGFAYTFDPELG